MKKIFTIMLCLFLLLVLVPRAVMNLDGSSYDPMADVNRDKTIDAYDLNRLGRAYGSTQTIPTQPGKTTIYVYQLETDPPQIENARVAIIDPSYDYQAVQVGYTNSQGLVNFTLNPNSNFTAIAWSQTTYSYANFTTNEFGEASIAVQLGYSHLPHNWVAITFLNRTSGALVFWANAKFSICEIAFNWEPTHGWYWVDSVGGDTLYDFEGIFIGRPSGPPHHPFESGNSYGVYVINVYGDLLADPVFTLDENGNANIVTYV